tara:strand:- start:569 stop:898 length:330 start_codon:yes stop_codon:yes gene_type:complete
MAHFSNIVQGIVEQVIVIDNQYENDGNTYINEVLNLSGNWIQTSYNSSIRGNFAGIGFTYDEENDVFYSPQPYPSWILNENWNWDAPTPYPNDGEYYDWNEEQLNWEIL